MIVDNFNVELAIIFWGTFLSEFYCTTFDIFFSAFEKFVLTYFSEEIALTPKIIEKIKYIFNSESFDSRNVLFVLSFIIIKLGYAVL